jgi:Ser-tRNA(Ala) deacylase AlaX
MRTVVRQMRQVWVVEIVGFDAQAYGHIHVRSTNHVGHFAIVRTENRGKINKQLYIHLAPTESLHRQITTDQTSHQPA